MFSLLIFPVSLKTEMYKIFFLLFSLSILNVQAQDSIDLNPIVDSIYETEIIETVPENDDEDSISVNLPENYPWESVKIDGKLKMQGLPLSPSLKIFMIKDSLIDISIRAPFVGEAGRILVTTDSVTAVNKMNKTYVNEGISDAFRFYPGGLSDIQDLLLARFFLPGFELTEDNINNLVDIYFDNEQFTVIPKGDAEIEGINYGYIVDGDFNPLALMILPESRPDVELDVQYEYNLQGYNIIISYLEGTKKREMTLELKNPEWTEDQSKTLEVNKKFRRLSFSEFISAF